MFISQAYAQAVAGAPDAGQSLVSLLVPFLMVGVVFYFLIFRPQQAARKRHTDMLAALKKGDIIVTSGGLIGKVKSVADDEVRVELGPNVEVRVIRGAIGEVRSKTEPAPANDSSKSTTAS